jgi:hypothetical protein
VATLAGFAAAQLSIEQIDGAVYSKGCQTKTSQGSARRLKSAADKPSGPLACSTKIHGCEWRESGLSWRRMPNSVTVDSKAASITSTLLPLADMKSPKRCSGLFCHQ